MTTYFTDYQQMVMQAYERKKANNTLPHGLLHLSPAKLKEECMKRCTREVNRRDEKIIRDFCGDLNEGKSCYAILQRCDTDRFKPLANYLRGKSENTYEKNIELLAWLVDFAGRPWEMGKTIPVDANGDPVFNDAGPAVTPESLANISLTGGDNPAKDPRDQEEAALPATTYGPKENESIHVKTTETLHRNVLKRKPVQSLVAAVMLLLALGTGSIWWWKDQHHTSKDCMYWREDHYEPIACNQKVPHTMIVALDTIKLRNFKKITRSDTLTYEDIGKVWYSKINGKMEYFTSGGAHPVVFGRELKPITIYIIDKHILQNMATK